MPHSATSRRRRSGRPVTIKADVSDAVRTHLLSALRALEPPPDLTVSQWADKFRYLSPEASAEPGKWHTSRAEYLRGIMDAITDPSI